MKKLVTIALILCFISCKRDKKATTLSDFINHYSNIKLPTSYKLKYQEEHFIPYQSYDYKHPNGLIASYITEIDDKEKQLYNESITNVGGGFTFDYITIIKDTIAFEYSANKLWKGDVIDSVNAKKNYTYYQKVSLNQLSVYKSKSLLDTPIDSLMFSFDKQNNTATITKLDKEDSIRYVFSMQPIRLKKIIKHNETCVFEKFKHYKDFSYATRLTFYTNHIIKKNVDILVFNDIHKITPDKLSLPKSFTFIRPTPKKDSVSKIGKNTYIIRDLAYNRNILFTHLNNEITVIGAPISDKFSKKVLTIIQNKLPNAKINFVYVTHLHSDHIMGLKEYAKRNITILADAYTIEGIKNFEPFRDTANTFTFKPVKDREIFNGIQFHYPKNKHCKSQGFAYCIKDNIIYQGDFMQVSPNLIAPTIMPETTLSFIERIYKDSLSVNTIVGQHQAGSEIPIAFLNTYYQVTKGQ